AVTIRVHQATQQLPSLTRRSPQILLGDVLVVKDARTTQLPDEAHDLSALSNLRRPHLEAISSDALEHLAVDSRDAPARRLTISEPSAQRVRSHRQINL